MKIGVDPEIIWLKLKKIHEITESKYIARLASLLSGLYYYFVSASQQIGWEHSVSTASQLGHRK